MPETRTEWESLGILEIHPNSISEEKNYKIDVKLILARGKGKHLKLPKGSDQTILMQCNYNLTPGKYAIRTRMIEFTGYCRAKSFRLWSFFC